MMMKGRRNCNDSSLAGGFVSLVIFVSHSLSVWFRLFSVLFCSVLQGEVVIYATILGGRSTAVAAANCVHKCSASGDCGEGGRPTTTMMVN